MDFGGADAGEGRSDGADEAGSAMKLTKLAADEFVSILRESGAVKSLFRFVWKLSARDQIFLSLLAIGVFLVDLVPLELQRRIANSAVREHDFKMVLLLSLVYVATAFALGGLKMALNVYRGSVTEKANRTLRLDRNLLQTVRTESRANPEEEGIAISIVVSEVEAVGGFVGSSFSEPVLNGGILLSVFGYMLFMQPGMALVALLLFVPQVLFIPLLQNAINMRTQKRIKTVRKLSVDIANEATDADGRRERSYRRRVGRVYGLNMEIYRRKYGMNFLMNLFYHFGVIGILFVGGWFLIQGKTEIGTVIAFISGLDRMNDPWGDLVNYFRDLTNAAVKYKLIERVFRGEKQAT
jgi:ABC-type bacteriocin/lantibiotic exporter with double-glycine peptidase domain